LPGEFPDDESRIIKDAVEGGDTVAKIITRVNFVFLPAK
jgi:hypothetical protein